MAKLRSGDKETAAAMVQAIMEGQTLPSADLIIPNNRPPTTQPRRPTTTTTKNVPYTRGGDGGTSQLSTGERLSKDDTNFEALGTVDELCAVAGVVHAHLVSSELDDEDYGELTTWMLDVMSRLFDIGSHVAKPKKGEDFSPNGIGDGFDVDHIDDLESWINEMTEALPELTSFILPTGAKAAAHLHVARTVCRRAERRVVPLVMDEQTCDPNALRYLNRLSDFFFVAARWVNFCEDQPEIQYQRDAPISTQRQRVSRSLKANEEEDGV
jgi:cob(I)alamin adenosyltransferase